MSVLMCTKSCKGVITDGAEYFLHSSLPFRSPDPDLLLLYWFLLYLRYRSPLVQGSDYREPSVQPEYLSIFSRKCKNRLAHMTSRTLIKQTVISSSRGNMDLLLTYHIMKPVCIDSGCIYHIPCPENPVICMDLPSFIYWFKIRNFRIKLNSTPFAFAFSAIAMFRLNGHTIPAVGA